MPHEFSDQPLAIATDAQQELNPYAPPMAQGPLLANEPFEPVGIWRLHNKIIFHRSLSLPPRCIRTNAACGKSERRTFRFNSNLVRLGIMGAMALLCVVGFSTFLLEFLLDTEPSGRVVGLTLGILGGLLAAIIHFRGSFEVRIPYYHSLADRRLRWGWRIASSIAIFLSLVLMLFMAYGLLPETIGIWIPGGCLLTILASSVAMMLSVIRFRIEPEGPNYYIVSGCGRPFLYSFPECAPDFRRTLAASLRLHL